MSGRTLALVATALLSALIVLWHLWLAPPLRVPALVALTLHAAPLLPALLLWALRHRAASFWASVAALFLFCHGVAELWSTPGLSTLAALEVLLCLAIIFAASWDGLRARLGRRRGV
jgi:uncharacterized membrane protein